MTYLLIATVMRIRYCDALYTLSRFGPKHISPTVLRRDGGAHCGIDDVGMAGAEQCGWLVTLYGAAQEPHSVCVDRLAGLNGQRLRLFLLAHWPSPVG